MKAIIKALDKDKTYLLKKVVRLELKNEKLNVAFDDLQMSTAEQAEKFVSTQLQLEEAKRSIKSLNHHSRKVAEEKNLAQTKWAREKAEKITTINHSYAKLTAALTKLRRPEFKAGWNLLLQQQNWLTNTCEITKGSIAIYGQLVEQRTNHAVFEIKVCNRKEQVDQFTCLVGQKTLYMSLTQYDWPESHDPKKLAFLDGAVQIWDRFNRSIDQINVFKLGLSNLTRQPQDGILVLNPNYQRSTRLSASIYLELSEVFSSVIKNDWKLFNVCQ